MSNERKIAQLEAEIKLLKDTVDTNKAELNRWKELYFSLRHSKYASQSEREDPNQLNFFNELEDSLTQGVVEDMTPAENAEEMKTKVNSYIRVKSTKKTMKAPQDTPVSDVYHHAEETPLCEECGSEKEIVSYLVQESITFIPSSYVIVRHHYPQYRCTVCAPDTGEYKKQTIYSQNILEKTICDPSLLATIIDEKMRFGLPLYRLEQRFKLDNGCCISRKTASAWMMFAFRQLTGLIDAMERALRKSIHWNMDETGLKIVKGTQTNSRSARNCHMIVRAATNEDGSRGPIVFTFSEHKKDNDFIQLIGDYSGIIQSDGLEGYENARKVCNFTHLGCLIHSRRKAKDILNINKKSVLAKELIALYGSIFHEEGILIDDFKKGLLTPDEFLVKRRTTLTPLFDNLKDWLVIHQPFALKKSKIATAINYPLKRWDTLVRFLDYPFATSTNQRAELTIKPFALGRKNFLFSYTPLGAQASALYYSLIETCKVMNIDTVQYLTFLFSHAKGLESEAQWDAMLPWNVDLQETQKYLETLKKAVPDKKRTDPYILRGKHPKKTSKSS